MILPCEEAELGRLGQRGLGNGRKCGGLVPAVLRQLVANLQAARVVGESGDLQNSRRSVIRFERVEVLPILARHLE